MNTKQKLLTLVLGVGFVGAANGQIGTDVDLVGWDTVNGTTVSATDLNTLVTGGVIARNGNLNQAAGGDFNTNNWDDEAAGDFLSWSIAVDATYQLDNLELTFFGDRSGTGPDSITVEWSNDGFATAGNSLGISGVDVGSSGTVQTSSSFGSAMTGSIDFRLTGTGATSGGGTFDFETGEVGPGTAYGVFVSGDVSAVPEPGMFGAIAGLLALGFVAVRRRRRS